MALDLPRSRCHGGRGVGVGRHRHPSQPRRRRSPARRRGGRASTTAGDRNSGVTTSRSSLPASGAPRREAVGAFDHLLRRERQRRHRHDPSGGLRHRQGPLRRRRLGRRLGDQRDVYRRKAQPGLALGPGRLQQAGLRLAPHGHRDDRRRVRASWGAGALRLRHRLRVLHGRMGRPAPAHHESDVRADVAGGHPWRDSLHHQRRPVDGHSDRRRVLRSGRLVHAGFLDLVRVRRAGGGRHAPAAGPPASLVDAP